MRINHNIAALNTHRQLSNNTLGASKSLEKLSSGFRINRAGDDAAGLAISEKMRAQIRGLEMAMKNSQDSISLIQTAEGAMNEVHSILQRMRELAVQAVNDTNTTSDREELQKEINQLTSEINRVGNTTEFNEKKLLNGSLAASIQTNSGSFTSGALLGTSQFARVGSVVTVGPEPIVWDNDSMADFQINISGTAANGFDWSSISGSVAAELVITRTASGFQVDFAGTDTSNRTLSINADAVAYDAATDTYSYANHGISFSFTGEQAADWAETDSVTIDLRNGVTVSGAIVASGEFSTVPSSQPYTVTSGGAGTSRSTLSNITVTGNQPLLDGADTVTISLSGAGNGFMVVRLYSSGVAGTLLSETVMSVQSGGNPVTYQADGIQFTFERGSGATATFSGVFTLEMADPVNVYGPSTSVSGTFRDGSLIFQTGSNENQTMTLAVEDIRAAALGIVGTTAGFTSGATVTNGTDSVLAERALNITTSSGAANAISVLDQAIKTVSAERSKLGAVQNRLEHTINNLGTSAENLTAAESRIRDVDMAKEMMEFTKNNILTQAAQAMLAQANQQPQGVLQLLR